MSHQFFLFVIIKRMSELKTRTWEQYRKDNWKDDLYYENDIVKVLDLEDEIHVWVRITHVKNKKFKGLCLQCTIPFEMCFEKWQIKDFFDETINGDFIEYMNW